MGKVVVKSWEKTPEKVQAEKVVQKEKLVVIYKKYPTTEEEEKEGPWYDFEEWFLNKVVEIIKVSFSKYGFPIEEINVIDTDDFGEYVDYEVVTRDGRRFLISLKVLEISEHYDHTLKNRVIEVTYRPLREIERDAEAIAREFNDFRNMVCEIATTYGIDNLVELLWKEIENTGVPDKLEFAEKIIRKILESAVAEKREIRAVKCGNSVHVAVRGIRPGERVIRARIAMTKINLIVPAEE